MQVSTSSWTLLKCWRGRPYFRGYYIRRLSRAARKIARASLFWLQLKRSFIVIFSIRASTVMFYTTTLFVHCHFWCDPSSTFWDIVAVIYDMNLGGAVLLRVVDFTKWLARPRPFLTHDGSPIDWMTAKATMMTTHLLSGSAEWSCTVVVFACCWGRSPLQLRTFITLLLAMQCRKLPSEEKSAHGSSVTQTCWWSPLRRGRA